MKVVKGWVHKGNIYVNLNTGKKNFFYSMDFEKAEKYDINKIYKVLHAGIRYEIESEITCKHEHYHEIKNWTLLNLKQLKRKYSRTAKIKEELENKISLDYEIDIPFSNEQYEEMFQIDY